MKTSMLIKYAAIAALAAAPAIASAAAGPIEACMNTFVAQNFPQAKASYVMTNENSFLRVPLALNSGTYQVLLRANDRHSGKLLGTATCAVRNNNVSIGDITVAPATQE